MLNQVYRDEDVDLDVLKGKTVAVLGYGIQGGPQALCLRDSGIQVIVGAGPRDQFPDWDWAVEDGFDVYSIAEATQAGGYCAYAACRPGPALCLPGLHP